MTDSKAVPPPERREAEVSLLIELSDRYRHDHGEVSEMIAIFETVIREMSYKLAAAVSPPERREAPTHEWTMRSRVLDRGGVVDDGEKATGGQSGIHQDNRADAVDLTADEALQVAEGPPTLRALVHDYIARGAELNALRASSPAAHAERPNIEMPLANAARGLMNAVPDVVLEALREEWGNTNVAVIQHWRELVRATLSERVKEGD